MKIFTRALLQKILRTLPLKVRRMMLDDLASDIGTFNVAGDIARKVGLTGFVAEGDAGVIRGALDDDAALARYARDGVWSPRQS
jgi:hypothetical protein